MVVRPLLVHPRQGRRVGDVAGQLVARAVVERLHRLEERLLLGQLGLGQPGLVRRGQLLERLLGLVEILLRPQRMVVAHRLAPVGEREVRVGLLRLLEGDGRLVELEVVQRLDAGEERLLRAGGPRRRKGDRAELLGGHLRRQRQGRHAASHRRRRRAHDEPWAKFLRTYRAAPRVPAPAGRIRSLHPPRRRATARRGYTLAHSLRRILRCNCALLFWPRPSPSRSAAPTSRAAAGRRSAGLVAARPDPPGRGRPPRLVTTGHPIASSAGLQILIKGGNAFDAVAAVGAMAALGEPEMNGIGGNGFMTVYHKATNTVWSVSMAGAAPKGIVAGGDDARDAERRDEGRHRPRQPRRVSVGARAVRHDVAGRGLRAGHRDRRARLSDRPDAGGVDRARPEEPRHATRPARRSSCPAARRSRPATC